jgi:membrane protease YdiL (CAAX protease family)
MNPPETVPAQPDSGGLPGGVSRVRLWLALVALSAAALLLATPLLLDVLQRAVAGHKVRLPLRALLGLQDVQILLLTSLAAALGVWMAPRVGLDAPVLRARLLGQRVGKRLLHLLPDAVLAGTVSAAAVLVLSLVLKPPANLGGPAPSPWVGLTGTFYGAVVEETLCRWGLLSLFLVGLRRLGAGAQAGFWVANLAAALAFGLLHLPPAFQLGVPRTVPVVAYILAGNAVVGLICGWLFRRRGLESAMLAHGSADLWLHVVFPALGV